MKIPIVNKNDEVIGYRDRTDRNPELFYRVSFLWVTDTEGNILLARRAFNKTHDPGKWGPAVAGTVEEGETYESNIIKETEEEIGLKNINPKLGLKRISKGKWNHFSQEFLLTLPKGFNDFKIAKDEVAEVRWFSKDELQKELSKNSNDFLKVIVDKLN